MPLYSLAYFRRLIDDVKDKQSISWNYWICLRITIHFLLILDSAKFHVLITYKHTQLEETPISSSITDPQETVTHTLMRWHKTWNTQLNRDGKGNGTKQRTPPESTTVSQSGGSLEAPQCRDRPCLTEAGQNTTRTSPRSKIYSETRVARWFWHWIPRALFSVARFPYT